MSQLNMLEMRVKPRNLFQNLHLLLLSLMNVHLKQFWTQRDFNWSTVLKAGKILSLNNSPMLIKNYEHLDMKYTNIKSLLFKNFKH
jgi:hypothetical protein